MNHKPGILSFCILVTAFAASPGIARAGVLNPPPGPVTGTTKTLSDVEPQFARGQTDFDYDFESLTAGQSITGQDGWYKQSELDSSVQYGTGVNTTKTVRGDADGLGGSSTVRFLPEAFVYTAADTAVEWRFDGYVVGGGNQNPNSRLRLPFPNAAVVFGGRWGDSFPPLTDTLRTSLRINNPEADHVGDVLTFGEWYQFKLIVDFSVPGGRATLYYRNLTDGEISFTTDSVIHDINLALGAANCSGGYQVQDVSAIAHLAFDPIGCRLDNIHVDAPVAAFPPQGPTTLYDPTLGTPPHEQCWALLRASDPYVPPETPPPWTVSAGALHLGPTQYAGQLHWKTAMVPIDFDGRFALEATLRIVSSTFYESGGVRRAGYMLAASDSQQRFFGVSLTSNGLFLSNDLAGNGTSVINYDTSAVHTYRLDVVSGTATLLVDSVAVASLAAGMPVNAQTNSVLFGDVATTGDSESYLYCASYTSCDGSPPPGGNMNWSCRTDGNDVQPFVNALLATSTDPFDLCHGDFSGNSIIDLTDVPGFVSALLGN